MHILLSINDEKWKLLEKICDKDEGFWRMREIVWEEHEGFWVLWGLLAYEDERLMGFGF